MFQAKYLGFIAAMTAASVIALTGSTSAWAKCTRLGFSVNDYGKDGPTKDAQELLDKHIAKTMADKGIAKFTVGKKEVKCELFLNFIVFDEHTCRAEANVCWEEGPAGAPKATPGTKTGQTTKDGTPKAAFPSTEDDAKADQAAKEVQPPAKKTASKSATPPVVATPAPPAEKKAVIKPDAKPEPMGGGTATASRTTDKKDKSAVKPLSPPATSDVETGNTDPLSDGATKADSSDTTATGGQEDASP